MKKKLVTITKSGQTWIIEIVAVPKTSNWGELEGYQVYHSKANAKISEDLIGAELLHDYIFDTYQQALKEGAKIVRAKINDFIRMNKIPKMKK
ncbi:MAG: hypothetical protein V4549_05795 [Bacteroidota bacterium]